MPRAQKSISRSQARDDAEISEERRQKPARDSSTDLQTVFAQAPKTLSHLAQIFKDKRRRISAIKKT